MTLPKLKIDDFCKTGSGGTPSRKNADYYKGQIPWVKSGDLRENIIYDTEEYISEDAVLNSSAKMVSKGAILLAMYGATVGRMARLGVDATTNQAVCHIIPDPKKADTEYLYYALLNQVPQFLAQAVGGAQPNINQGIIKNTEIYLPDLSTQTQIAKILDKSTALIAKRKAQIAELDGLVQSVFLDMFGDPITNPKGWDKGHFSDICIINPKAEKYDDELDVSFVPMQMVSENSFEISYEVKKYAEVKKGFTAFIENDVLFAKITPCMENGKAGIAKNLKNNIGFGSTEFHVFRPKDEVYCSFIYNLIHLSLFRKLSAQHFAGAVGHKRVPKDFLEKFDLYLPDFSSCQKFDLITKKIQTQKSQLQQSLAELEMQHQALMQRAFRGELV